MFRRGKRVVVQLTAKEIKMLQSAMISFRNMAIRKEIPTEDIDAVILRLCKS